MAENNSSAPLKTAEGDALGLPEAGRAALTEYLQICDKHAITPDVGGAFANAFRAGANYAAQVLEAQAPAAVAVPPAVPGLSGDAALAHEQCRAVVHLALAVAEVYSSNALIVASDSRLADQIGAASAEVMEYLGDTLNSTDATTEEDEWLEPIFEGAQERWPVAQQPVCDSVHTDGFGKVATPALPATEDSSAGDLAEVQAEPTDAEIIDLNDGERYFSMSESRFGKDVNPHTQYHTGEPGYLQFARAVLARWGAAPQAQPADALERLLSGRPSPT